VLVSDCSQYDRWRVYKEATESGISEVLFRPHEEVQLLQAVRGQLRVARLRRQAAATRTLVEQGVLPDILAAYPGDMPPSLALAGHESRLRRAALRLQALVFGLPAPVAAGGLGRGEHLRELLERVSATLR